MGAPHYDVFLSYAWEDIELAERFQEELQARGLTVFRDVTGMRDYDDIPTVIRAALDGSRALVALYTPSFPESQYCRWELYTSLTASYHLSGQTQRIMAVVRGLRFSQVLSSRLKCLRLPPVDAALDDVAGSVAGIVAGLDDRRFGDAPQPPLPTWYPRPAVGTHDFRGRLSELWEIRDAFDGDDGAGSDTPPVVTVVGGGGTGKTMLAEEYGRLFAADHAGGVFVLSGLGSHQDLSRDPLRVRALVDGQIAAVAAGLRLTGPADPPGVARAALRAHLTAVGLPYLWILDDLPGGVDTGLLRDLIAPTPLGRTLVTSRYPCPGRQGTRIDLGDLTDLDALALLTSRRQAARGPERQSAKRVVAEVGRHPLALAVAAELAAAPDSGGFTGLLRSLGTPAPDVLETAERLGVELPTEHSAGICATMLRGVDRLGSHGVEAMRVASLLAPAPLAEDLLAEITEQARDVPAADALASVRRGLGNARTLALARTAGPGRWSVHALVSRVVRLADLDETARARAREAAVRVMSGRLAAAPGGSGRAGVADVLPHVQVVAAGRLGEDERHLLNEAARVHSEDEDSFAALRIFRDLYEGCRTALGEHDITTLRVLVGLAAAAGMCGDHETALRMKQEAHSGLAGLLGPQHPDTLTARNNVAVTLFDLGDLAAAREAFAEVYRARRTRLSVQHPETLQALGNVAAAASRQGRHRLAERLRMHLLARTERALGVRHPQYADALNGMGATTLALGRDREAADWFAQAYRLRRDLDGPSSPGTLDVLENIHITRAAGDGGGTAMDTADGLRDVYLRRLQAQGPGHPAAAVTLRHCLLASLPDDADAPFTPSLTGFSPVDPLPDATPSFGDLRLEAPDMDRRVETFELACTVQEQAAAAEEGAADPVRAATVALVAQLWLAHATALLDQFDEQFVWALSIAEDTMAELAREFGHDHPLSRSGRLLADWMESLVDAAEV